MRSIFLAYNFSIYSNILGHYKTLKSTPSKLELLKLRFDVFVDITAMKFYIKVFVFDD